jgi:hypothetical protein
MQEDGARGIETLRAGMGVLRLGDCYAGDFAADLRGDPPGGFAVAAANVTDFAGSGQPGFLDDDANEVLLGFFIRLTFPQPQAVMDVRSPDVAIKGVQVVVVCGDCIRRKSLGVRSPQSAIRHRPISAPS